MLWVVCVAWQEGMRARDGRVRIVERVDDVVRRAGAAWRPRQGIQVVTRTHEREAYSSSGSTIHTPT